MSVDEYPICDGCGRRPAFAPENVDGRVLCIVCADHERENEDEDEHSEQEGRK